MGTPIVYEEPSPIGSALAGIGAYGQEQERRKEVAAQTQLQAQAEAAREKEAAANLSLNTRAQAEIEKHDTETINERYYTANQQAYQREQDRIEKHWEKLQTLAQQRIEFAARMKLDYAKIQQQYAAAAQRYETGMARIAQMAEDTKANNDTKIQTASMQIQGRLDTDYNNLAAGMSKAEYQAIEAASRATGSSIDPNTGLPTNYDPNYTPAGGGNTTINYVVPPGYTNPATGKVQGGASGGGGAKTTPAAQPSFKSYADKALALLQGGQSAQSIMQAFVASKVYQSLSPDERNRWSAGLAHILNINAPPSQ